MRHWIAKGGILIAALAAFVVVVYALFFLYAERRYEAARASVEEIPILVFYDRLIHKLEGEELDGPICNNPSLEHRFTDASDEALLARLKTWKALLYEWESIFVQDQRRPHVRDLSDSRDTDLSAEDWEVVETLLTEYADFIERVGEAAPGGGPVYPLDFSKGMDMELPHLAMLRDCTRLISLRARRNARNGNADEAVADILLITKLVKALAVEPLDISKICCYFNLETRNLTITEAFNPGTLPLNLTEELAGDVFPKYLKGNLSETMLVETASMADLYTRDATSAWTLRNDITSFMTWYWWLRGSPLGRPWRNLDHSIAISKSIEQTQFDDKPFYALAEQLAEAEEYFHKRYFLFYEASGRAFQPVHTLKQRAEAEALFELTRLGLLIELYKRQNGGYPESLALITDGMGKPAPVDPFTGTPYIYTRDDAGGFLLYSVGRNLDDDGGIHDPVAADIVWRGIEPDP